ncbi:MAG: AmmeMemoRadiSam system protein A [Phycisphaerales bacterium]|nr:MAG: AmmeMemoRadiSam system protein A [Phycisphaerales bacterium]
MDADDRRFLLELARATMVERLGGRPNVSSARRDLPAEGYGGLFVSLHKDKQLRGCMGTFSIPGDLARAVESMSVAVLNDPRFVTMPVTLKDLPELDIEISLLSRPEPTDDPLSLEIGRHGIIVERGGHTGCFLPQVGSQFGWTAERLLSECCAQKAHLPADAWKEPQTRVSLFTAEVLSESP